jgi:hypothetical protein
MEEQLITISRGGNDICGPVTANFVISERDGETLIAGCFSAPIDGPGTFNKGNYSLTIHDQRGRRGEVTIDAEKANDADGSRTIQFSGRMAPLPN